MQISEEQRKQLLSYMWKRPYGEVASLIAMLVSLTVPKKEENKANEIDKGHNQDIILSSNTYMKEKTITWQDRRIKAMNRMMDRKGSHLHEKYLDEYHSVLHSKAKNKQQYKGEVNDTN